MAWQVRIFLGYRYHKELKKGLLGSVRWQAARLIHPTTLQVINWQGAEYVGLFLASLLTGAQIQAQEREVQERVRSYCPHLDLDRHPLYLLAQTFIT